VSVCLLTNGNWHLLPTLKIVKLNLKNKNMENQEFINEEKGNNANCMLVAVKLSKKTLNEFIGWTTSRYNDYLGYGTKKQNVDTVYNSLKSGFFTDERGKQEPTKTIFKIQCASPVGENGNFSKGQYRGWKTKQAGDDYTIDCIEKTIVAKFSKRTIKFDLSI